MITLYWKHCQGIRIISTFRKSLKREINLEKNGSVYWIWRNSTSDHCTYLTRFFFGNSKKIVLFWVKSKVQSVIVSALNLFFKKFSSLRKNKTSLQRSTSSLLNSFTEHKALIKFQIGIGCLVLFIKYRENNEGAYFLKFGSLLVFNESLLRLLVWTRRAKNTGRQSQ